MRMTLKDTLEKEDPGSAFCLNVVVLEKVE
jgi:hypothetical protein